MKKELKPIHKFNGGRGATLCNNCTVIISEALTQEFYCDKCKEDKAVQDYYKQMDKEVHFNRANLNK